MTIECPVINSLGLAIYEDLEAQDQDALAAHRKRGISLPKRVRLHPRDYANLVSTHHIWGSRPFSLMEVQMWVDPMWEAAPTLE